MRALIVLLAVALGGCAARPAVTRPDAIPPSGPKRVGV